MSPHWATCPQNRTNSFGGRRYCADCGVWLDPTPEQPWRIEHAYGRMTGDRDEAEGGCTPPASVDRATKEPHP